MTVRKAISAQAAQFVRKPLATSRLITARRSQHSLPPLLILPHPDDIVFDWATGEAAVTGPVLSEQIVMDSFESEFVIHRARW